MGDGALIVAVAIKGNNSKTKGVVRWALQQFASQEHVVFKVLNVQPKTETLEKKKSHTVISFSSSSPPHRNEIEERRRMTGSCEWIQARWVGSRKKPTTLHHLREENPRRSFSSSVGRQRRQRKRTTAVKIQERRWFVRLVWIIHVCFCLQPDREDEHELKTSGKDDKGGKSRLLLCLKQIRRMFMTELWKEDTNLVLGLLDMQLMMLKAPSRWMLLFLLPMILQYGKQSVWLDESCCIYCSFGLRSQERSTLYVLIRELQQTILPNRN